MDLVADVWPAQFSGFTCQRTLPISKRRWGGAHPWWPTLDRTILFRRSHCTWRKSPWHPVRSTWERAKLSARWTRSCNATTQVRGWLATRSRTLPFLPSSYWFFQDTFTSTLELYGEPKGYSAMAKSVGVTCGIAAQLLLDGHKALNVPGVLAPYDKAICEPIRELVEKEGIKMVERLVWKWWCRFRGSLYSRIIKGRSSYIHDRRFGKGLLRSALYGYSVWRVG